MSGKMSDELPCAQATEWGCACAKYCWPLFVVTGNFVKLHLTAFKLIDKMSLGAGA